MIRILATDDDITSGKHAVSVRLGTKNFLGPFLPQQSTKHKHKGRSKVPKPHLCLLPEDLNVRSGWNSYLCVILTCICAYVCVYIHIYLYIYMCADVWFWFFCVCILVFLVLGFFVQTGKFSHVQERPWTLKPEMVLILYLCAPHCKDRDIYVWFPKDFQDSWRIALVVFGTSGDLSPFGVRF